VVGHASIIARRRRLSAFVNHLLEGRPSCIRHSFGQRPWVESEFLPRFRVITEIGHPGCNPHPVCGSTPGGDDVGKRTQQRRRTHCDPRGNGNRLSLLAGRVAREDQRLNCIASTCAWATSITCAQEYAVLADTAMTRPNIARVMSREIALVSRGP